MTTSLDARIRRGTLLAIVAIVLILTWFAFCRPRPAPLPPKDQKTVDSLHVTAPDYVHQQQQLVVEETTYVTKAARAIQRADTSAAKADSLGHVADSLQAMAQAQGDTSLAWKETALARAQEADSLKASNDSLRSANRADSMALAAADARALRAAQRDSVSEALNARLARDVSTAGQCRVLPFVSCPSRTVAFVGGGLLGAAALYTATHPKQVGAALRWVVAP